MKPITLEQGKQNITKEQLEGFLIHFDTRLIFKHKFNDEDRKVEQYKNIVQYQKYEAISSDIDMKIQVYNQERTDGTLVTYWWILYFDDFESKYKSRGSIEVNDLQHLANVFTKFKIRPYPVEKPLDMDRFKKYDDIDFYSEKNQ